MLCLGASFLAVAEDNPFLKNTPSTGAVSLPLKDWQEVWRAASRPATTEAAAAKPPMSGMMQSASYAASLESHVLRCDAVFVVKSLSEEWQTVPIAGPEWTVDTAATIPAGVALVRQGGQLCALVHGVADFELKLPLVLPLSVADDSGSFTLVAAAAQRFVLAPLPDKRVLMLDGRGPAIAASGEQTYALPGKDGAVSLAVIAEPAAPPPPPPPPEPSTWTADAQIAAHYEEGSLVHAARVFLRAAKGSGLEAALLLPAAAQVSSVTGDDTLTWKLARSDDGASRVVHLKWKTEDRLDRKVQMQYALPQSPVATQWNLAAPAANEPGRAAFALAPVEGIEFSHAALVHAPGTRVLAWIREAAPASEYLIVEGSTNEALTAKALPRVESAKATIKSWHAHTRLVDDGSALHQLDYEFEHRGLNNWSLTLPQGATLLACTMNGSDFRPVQRSPLALEFALPAKDESAQTTKLCVTYHMKGKAWDKISGSIESELPKSELFTRTLHWQIEMPDGYELVASGDTLKPAATIDAAAADRTVAFQKELFTSEPPAIELFYHRLDAAR